MACRLCVNNRRYSAKKQTLLIAKDDRYEGVTYAGIAGACQGKFVLKDAKLTLVFRSREAVEGLTHALFRFLDELYESEAPSPPQGELPF